LFIAFHSLGWGYEDPLKKLSQIPRINGFLCYSFRDRE
jgi:hypothetical protein